MSSDVMLRRITADRLADVLGASLGATTRLLEEMEADGLVERCGGNWWRLTVAAESDFGRAFRELEAGS